MSVSLGSVSALLCSVLYTAWSPYHCLKQFQAGTLTKLLLFQTVTTRNSLQSTLSKNYRAGDEMQLVEQLICMT